MGFCDLGREEEIQNQLLAVCTQWLALLVAWEERAVSCGLSLGLMSEFGGDQRTRASALGP